MNKAERNHTRSLFHSLQSQSLLSPDEGDELEWESFDSAYEILLGIATENDFAVSIWDRPTGA